MGLDHGQSWEREIEMAVDSATSHNVGLTAQFFDDATGPRMGYAGALDCLNDYVGQPCAPGLTKENVDKLRKEWEAIANRIHAAHSSRPRPPVTIGHGA